MFRVLDGVSGFIGIAPGPNNFVVQLHDKGYIPSPVFTITPGTLYLGEQNTTECFEWNSYKPANENGWFYEVERVEFNGLTSPGRFVVSLKCCL